MGTKSHVATYQGSAMDPGLRRGDDPLYLTLRTLKTTPSWRTPLHRRGTFIALCSLRIALYEKTGRGPVFLFQHKVHTVLRFFVRAQ